MPRYIDADLIKEKLQKTIINAQTSFINNILIGLLDKAPTADVQGVKHGKWKMGVDEADYEYGTCSICGYVESDAFSRCNHPFYCSNCGAKMDDDVE